MGDDMQTITEQAAKDARDVFESYGSKAREAIDYMEQLIYAALRKTERALPAASSEDVRAEALTHAMEACRIIDDVVNEGHDNAYGVIMHFMDAVEPARAALALIPETKP